MADTDSTKPDKTKLYIAIGCGVVALILIVVVIITYMNGGDGSVAGGGAAAAAAAAAEAARRQRGETRKQVADTKTGLDNASTTLTDNSDKAKAGMAAVDTEIATNTRDENEQEGEDAFKPDGSA